MARGIDVSQYGSFDQISNRLDEIVDTVKNNGTSLERSLDLFEEALALGSAAVELVDATALTDAEKARLAGEETVTPTEASTENSTQNHDETSAS